MALTKKPPARPTHTFNANTFAIAKGEKGAFASSMVQEAGRYLEAGEIEAAEKCLRIGLERCPGHAQCLAYVAVCVAVRQRKFRAAEELVRKILRDHPNEATAYYALGRIHLANETRARAFRHFAKARRLAGKNEHLRGELDRIEPRRASLLPFLPRNNYLNILLGKLRAAIIGRTRR